MEKQKVYLKMTGRELSEKDLSNGILQVARVFPEGQPQLISGEVVEKEGYFMTEEQYQKVKKGLESANELINKLQQLSQ